MDTLAAQVSNIASAMPKMSRSGSWPTSRRTPMTRRLSSERKTDIVEERCASDSSLERSSAMAGQ
eukprot:scaffold48791_cov59-Phaeocystis_antarctica.AAC.10